MKLGSFRSTIELRPLDRLGTIRADGRRGGTRTRNPRFWRPVLCQLSYTPKALSFAASRARMQDGTLA